jgi:hypothetical protein
MPLPLGGVFFLEQATGDEALPIGGGEALCFLNEVAEQVAWIVAHGMAPGDAGAMRLRHFENLARLAADVPCAKLRTTLHGAFWEEILRISAAREERPACARS